ncbi:MAG: CapA family protein [Anaerolineaceae bacterium]
MALLALCGCQTTPTVAITFGGDVILARDGQALFARSNPWLQVNDAVQDQQKGASQAFFFANLESPIYDPLTSQKGQIQSIDLCAQVDQLDVLKQGGISLVNVANNHADDCGNNLKKDARRLIEEKQINVVGPDLTPVYLETQAGRVGILAAEDVSQPIDEVALIDALRIARQKCDILIVSMHWGSEYQTGANQRQIDLANKLAEAGVDILWGTHPHVLQPIKTISSSIGDHQMVAMFSLGNLLADQWMMSATQQTALVTFQIRSKKIVGFSKLPLQIDRTKMQLTLPNTEVTKLIEERLGVTNWKEEKIRILLPEN